MTQQSPPCPMPVAPDVHMLWDATVAPALTARGWLLAEEPTLANRAAAFALAIAFMARIELRHREAPSAEPRAAASKSRRALPQADAEQARQATAARETEILRAGLANWWAEVGQALDAAIEAYRVARPTVPLDAFRGPGDPFESLRVGQPY